MLARSEVPRRCRRALRRSGCGCRTSTRSVPDYLQYPQYDDRLADGVQARDRAVLRQPGARGSQPARSDHGRLLVRQRARGAALRHSQRHRAAVPPRDAARQPPRHSRPRQHPGADLELRSHVAGVSRQVGDGSAARQPAAAAAAQRAGARRSQADRRRPDACRCASAWRSTARTRRATRATA